MAAVRHVEPRLLTCCDHDRIYPAFGDLPFEPQRDVAVACDGCVPLLWLASFSA